MAEVLLLSLLIQIPSSSLTVSLAAHMFWVAVPCRKPRFSKGCAFLLWLLILVLPHVDACPSKTEYGKRLFVLVLGRGLNLCAGQGRVHEYGVILQDLHCCGPGRGGDEVPFQSQNRNYPCCSVGKRLETVPWESCHAHAILGREVWVF